MGEQSGREGGSGRGGYQTIIGGEIRGGQVKIRAESCQEC